MRNPTYFDQIYPNLPIADPASQAVRNDFAATFTQKWPDSTLSQSGYGSEDLAAMLVTSQYLQRLALLYGEDVGPCLNGQAANQINVAKTHFITSMQSAGDEKAALRAIRIWRGRTALMVALSDLAGREGMPQQMEWLSEAAQTVLSATIQYLFRQTAQRGKIKSFDADLSGCGWTVLALGKLGAGELNFSSDIDLIMLHDTQHAPFDNSDAVQPFLRECRSKIIANCLIGWVSDWQIRVNSVKIEMVCHNRQSI